MRKVVLSVGISLDGYIARPNGAVDFLFMPKDYSMARFMKTVDLLVMGRKTYEVAVQMGGSFEGSPPAYVFSHSLAPGERDGVVFIDDSPVAFLKRIRKTRGKDLWLMGGGELARAFLSADLVDEIHLGIVPVLLGQGIPLFPSGFPQREFALVENNTYAKGMVALRYRRARPKRKPRKR